MNLSDFSDFDGIPEPAKALPRNDHPELSRGVAEEWWSDYRRESVTADQFQACPPQPVDELP